MQQAAYSKKNPAWVILFNPNAGLSLLGHLWGLFLQCLGSLCTFYFIVKIVSVSILFKSMQSNICGVNH